MEHFKKIINNVLLFLIVFLIVQFLSNLIFGNQDPIPLPENQLIISTSDSEYSRKQKVTLNITNTYSSDVTIKNDCPKAHFNVDKKIGNNWEPQIAAARINCDDQKIQVSDLIIPAGESIDYQFEYWNYALFGQMGRFRISTDLNINDEEVKITSNEFIVEKEGLLSAIWHGIYRAIYNLLILLIAYSPGLSLGIGIILLTIVIRSILLIPSQKGLRAQRRIQEIQPRIHKIQEKYKGDQQRIAMETMAIWRAEKISPLSGCLPILLQFPFLIALFYVVKDGLNPDNTHLLYAQYNNLNISEINTQFLSLDLTEINILILPIIVGTLQFIQMKLTTAKAKDHTKGKNKKKEVEMANKTMTYVMPVMIALFTASVPAGVGIYWGTSTIYGIIQQYFVNNSTSTTSSNNEPTVKVIEPKD